MSNQPPEAFNRSVLVVFKLSDTWFPFTVIPVDPVGGVDAGGGVGSGAVGELQAENPMPSAANKAAEPAVFKKSFLVTSTLFIKTRFFLVVNHC
jgi:hypothetical protein